MQDKNRVDIVFGALIALLLEAAPGSVGAAVKGKPQVAAEAVKQVIETKAKSTQLVTFPDTGWSSVKVMRGGPPTRNKLAPPQAEKAEMAEFVTFGDSHGTAVRILRGETDGGTAMPRPPHPVQVVNTQVVSFTDPRARPVSVLRGWAAHILDTDLFGPASTADLDRIAFAVDGAESSHGADLRMWRAEPNGPQGPMQVTAAAAIDAGGGDRFDLAQNRALGRAYLARMYRRYGNWPDAITAYNWGPANVDAWIGGGRDANKFPLEVERYRDRVLRETALGRWR
jgi:Transglycosylase SLT domain